MQGISVLWLSFIVYLSIANENVIEKETDRQTETQRDTDRERERERQRERERERQRDRGRDRERETERERQRERKWLTSLSRGSLLIWTRIFGLENQNLLAVKFRGRILLIGGRIFSDNIGTRLCIYKKPVVKGNFVFWFSAQI